MKVQFVAMGQDRARLRLGLDWSTAVALAGGHAHRRLWAIVVLAVIGCFVVTIALQTIDWAPAMKVE